jgi:hypothetical protein
MQPPDFDAMRPDATTSSSRIYSRVLTENITGDTASAALMEALFDKDRLTTGDREGVWIQYNTREIRKMTNLTYEEQRLCRRVLIQQKLVNFATNKEGSMQFIINHPLFREKIAEQIGVPPEDWV